MASNKIIVTAPTGDIDARAAQQRQFVLAGEARSEGFEYL
jgi:hypothetical protein